MSQCRPPPAELVSRAIIVGSAPARASASKAALVLASRRRRDRFDLMVHLLRMDWCDVLMAGGVGQDDWRAVLDDELGVSGR